jgi:hypothetical protein
VPPYALGVKTTHAAATASLIALVLAGCATPQNDRLTIGRGVQLEVFYPAEQALAPEGGAVLAEQTPTLVLVVRSNWEPTAIVVPVDGTAHRPLWHQRVHLTDATSRQRNEYPSPLSALELTGGSESQQQVEALANTGMAALDALLFLPSVVIYPPWRTRWSPAIAWERYWEPELTPAVQQIAPAAIVPAEPPVPPTAP